MYRNNTELLFHEQVNFVMNHGALGDMISSLPAVIHAHRTHAPQLKMRVWVPPWQMELVDELLSPYGEFEIMDFNEFEKVGAKRKPEDDGPCALNSLAYNQHTRNRVDMVDFAFASLLDARPENDEQRNYPNAAAIGDVSPIGWPYVLFPVGATSQNKELHASVLEPLLAWAIDRDYKPVIVGTHQTHTHAVTAKGMEPLTITDHFDEVAESVKARCRDLRDQTNLLQLRDLCGHAEAVVGLDGGTLHLAATTKVPIVYGLTTLAPRHRSIVRDGIVNLDLEHVVPRNLECAGCSSNMTLAFRHDFRFCAYGDNACTKALDPYDFVTALERLGL